MGAMGAPMSLNILKAGHELTVWNRTASRMEPIVSAGAHAGSSPKDVAAHADVTLVCVSMPEDVRSVVSGPRGVLEGASRGAVVADHSTVDPRTTQDLYALAKERGVDYLDAPVSGGTQGAKAGTLTIMVGGEESAFTRAKPAFEATGKNIHYVGGSGSGDVIKLVNQLMAAINVAAIAEGFVLGVKAGAKPEVMYEIIKTSTGGSRMLDSDLLSRLIPGEFEPGFALDLMHKDIRLANDLGRELKMRLLLTGLVQQVLQESQAAGLGSRHYSVITTYLEQLSGVSLGPR
jgi:3-hydroxyisobutyrate dehydrogenase-like beta-hydroxyacid dehydrogenase